MLNKSGVTRVTLVNDVQILANAELQSSVGCVVDDAIVANADSDGRKIAKAGTPIKVVLSNLQTPAVLANATVVMNAVLLHDVDVTNGDANGTALIFGFVNRSRLTAATNALVTTALTATGVSPLLTFLTV